MELENDLKDILSSLNLTELQIRCYITLLKSGGMKVSQLAKKIGVNRPNTYTLLEKLDEYDLIFEESLVSGKVVHTKPYKSIVNAIEEKKEKLKDDSEKLKKLAPFFDSLKNSSKSYLPNVRTYETKYALDTVADDILSKNDSNEILLFSNQETEKFIFTKKTHDDFIRNRVKRGINIRVLSVNNVDGRKLKDSDKKMLRETNLLPKGFEFNSEIYIYNNKIAMIDVKEEIIGVIIESEELYKVHKQMFEMLWQICI